MAVLASLFVLYCMIYTTGATSNLIVRPDKFDAINGPALTVNCTFDYSNSSNIVSLVSIFLYKGDDQSLDNSRFTEIAMVTFSAINVVNVLTPGNASTSGLVSKDGQSFLSLYWEHPSLNEEGLYQCNITGVDRTGKCVEISHTSKVTAHKPKVDQLIETVRHQIMEINDVRRSLEALTNLENTISNMKTSLEIVLTKQTTLENALTNLTKTLTQILEFRLHNFNVSLTNIIKQLFQKQTLMTPSKLFNRSSEYKGNYYLLSKNRNDNVSDSQFACEQEGGYLAEIDDSREQEFVENFLNNQSVNYVLTGGTDEGHEYKWTWRTGQQASYYTNWESMYPRTNLKYNCLWLYKMHNWRWQDDICNGGNNYLCEVPKF